jgi:hypothetical protein
VLRPQKFMKLTAVERPVPINERKLARLIKLTWPPAPGLTPELAAGLKSNFKVSEVYLREKCVFLDFGNSELDAIDKVL